MSPKLHVGVMGAGSVGCYVGGKLLAHGAAEVTLVGRGRVQDELARHGLRVCGLEGEGEHISAADVCFEAEIGALGACDVVVVAVKSAQTEEVGERLAAIVRPDALIVSFQNGVANAAALRQRLPASRVVPAIVGFNVVSRGGGVFHRGTDGPIALQRTASPWFEDLAGALAASGLDVDVEGDLVPHQWTKLLINLNNAVSALSGAPTLELVREAAYRRIVAALIEEGGRVLRAAGMSPAPLRGIPVRLMPAVLRLPQPLARLVLAKQMKVDPTARSSMWEDLERRRVTEVEYLNGEIVHLAERAGAHAPLNTRIVALVHDAEEAGQGSPGLDGEALWAALSR